MNCLETAVCMERKTIEICRESLNSSFVTGEVLLISLAFFIVGFIGGFYLSKYILLNLMIENAKKKN